MTDALFDEASAYDDMLQRGLRLSGEDKWFFMEGRLARLRDLVAGDFEVRHILDFGCGNGDTSGRLLECFGADRVVGLDVSAGALEHARRHHGSDATAFEHLDAFDAPASFDLCYSNGAFHHIDPGQRRAVLQRLRELLRPSGLLALFENNPWNPGTRLVMSRVAFDRDAKLVTPARMRRLLADSGFEMVGPVVYLFVFPAPLKALRFTERRLERLPLGTQYLVLARAPAT